MYCKNCGKEIKDDAKYCPYCGTESSHNMSDVINGEVVKNPNDVKKSNKSGSYDGISIAAFVCALCGIGILGIIFGAIGINNTKDNAKKGQGFAIAGLIIGICVTAVEVIKFWIW
ncbi:MAG: zinc-ribbon domain-containing protein [Bacilli bacterium]